jgi:hypothetical protein
LASHHAARRRQEGRPGTLRNFAHGADGDENNSILSEALPPVHITGHEWPGLGRSVLREPSDAEKQARSGDAERRRMGGGMDF